MALITREVSIDVAKLNRFAAIVAKQYDKQSRFLKVTLLNNDEPMGVDPGATVVINARRPDNVAKSFAGEVNGDGTVTVPLTYWMLELDGLVDCDISIIVGKENVLTTTLFELQVQEAACENDAVSKDEDYGILVTLIDSVQKTADTLRTSYEASAKQMQSTYEASMKTAVERCDKAVTDTQLVTGPLYVVDKDSGKTYTAAIQVSNGKPVCVYDEVK